MPRRYYRSRTRVIRPKKKWATNLKQAALDGTSPTSVLVENSVQTSSPTPIVIKSGNFKIQGDFSIHFNTSVASTPQIALVLFFLPQGVPLDSSTTSAILSNHPEWIMGWKQLDTVISTTSASANFHASSFSFSSRLKRNLNSGDRICAGFTNDTPNAVPTIKFTAQYWTCAN